MLRDHRYIIIGGTTKAATTSLFWYFFDHADVCASSMKETRFFMDPSYPVPTSVRYEDGLDKYESFFNCPNKPFRLEATPDYLYCPRAARLIKASLSKFKCLFVLRDPIARLVSWYNFARQKDLIPPDLSFEKYIRLQCRSEGAVAVPQHLRSLEQGRYGEYLESFLQHVDVKDVLVVWFEDLVRSPTTEMQRICEFCGLDPRFFDGYSFVVRNRTKVETRGHIRFLRRILDKYARPTRGYVRHFTQVHAVFRRLARAIREDAQTASTPTAPTHRLVLPADLANRLRQYYEQDYEKLAALIGEPPPWQKHC